MSHRFIIIDHELEALEKGLRVVVLDREEMLLPRSLVSEHEKSSVSIHGSRADRSDIVAADEFSDCAAIHFVNLLLDQLLLLVLAES